MISHFAFINFAQFSIQISSNILVKAQDEDLLVTEFSIIGATSSGSSSTASGTSSMSTSGFESRSSTGSGAGGSTETGTFSSKHRNSYYEQKQNTNFMRKKIEPQNFSYHSN